MKQSTLLYEKENIVTEKKIQADISVIKIMVEKAKKETAESGHFFLGSGLFSMAAAPLIYLLETAGLDRWLIPALALFAAGGGVIGFLTVNRSKEKKRVSSYAKRIFYNTWIGSSVPMLLCLFFFPLTGVYSWNLVPVMISLFAGTGLFITGTAFEMKSITWSSLAWWGGACILAFTQNGIRLAVMEAILFFGWVIPGWIFNRTYRKKEANHG